MANPSTIDQPTAASSPENVPSLAGPTSNTVTTAVPTAAMGPENVPNLSAPSSGLTVNITAAAPTAGPAWTVSGPVTVQATPGSGGTVSGSTSGDYVAVGQGSANHNLSGGNGDNVLVSGGGQNVMSAIGAATTWVHNAGGTDVWLDFSAGAGDKITWDKSLTIAQQGQGTINDPTDGLSNAPGLVMVFSDGSKVGIPTVTDHTAVDPSWLVPASAQGGVTSTLPASATPSTTSVPATPTTASPSLPASGSTATVTPAPQNGPEFVAPMLGTDGQPSGTATVAGAGLGGSIMVDTGSGNSVLLGGPGNDNLVGTSSGTNNVLSGGGGGNTLTGGGTSTFVHSPGSTDVVTDWKAGDHITLDKSTTLDSTLTGQGSINDAQANLNGAAGLVMVFDEHDSTGAVTGHSVMALAHVAAAAPDPTWFV